MFAQKCRLEWLEMKLDAYTVVFLRRPSSAPKMSDEQLDALQARHLEFNRSMREGGQMVVGGPFIAHPDPLLRGMNVYRTSLEETTRVAHQDPSVQAGRLEVTIVPWLVPAGLLGDRPAYQMED